MNRDSRPATSPRSLCLIMLLIATTAITAWTAVIQVPTDAPNIQAAINLAADGDTIVVAPGLYGENLDFQGKAITVTSSGGPDVTTIDGGGLDSVVVFQTGEGASSVLEGFTIQGGFSVVGGAGIRCFDSCPTILGNTISGNTALDGGGGLLMILYYSSPVDAGEIRDNKFLSNTTQNSGGGIYLYGYGGSMPVIDGNEFTGNTAGALGGGINAESYQTEEPILISNSTFSGNVADYQAGGMAVYNYSSPQVRLDNLLVVNNSCGDGAGGGINAYAYQAPGAFIGSSTIANNSANFGGGIAISVEYGAPGEIENSIVWNNLTGGLTDVQIDTFTQTLTAGYSLIMGGAFTGPSLLDTDPLLVSGPEHDYYLSHTAAGQLVDSPAIDAGNPATPVIGGTTRTDGELDAGTIDLGYHALPGDPIFIRGDANADGTLDIADAITTLSALFVPGSVAVCQNALDANDDEAADIADAIYSLSTLFVFGPPPAAPYPDCGTDPTPGALACDGFPICP